MNHTDHVNLLRPAKLPFGRVWADLGAGTGAFTLALRELIGAEAKIFAVDRAASSLNQLKRLYESRFGETDGLRLVPADFSGTVQGMPELDGILMANSLHFFKDKVKILKHVGNFLRPKGVLILVEYNVDAGNPWVPYPISFRAFQKLAPSLGFSQPRLLATHPSSFLREFYSASVSAIRPAPFPAGTA